MAMKLRNPILAAAALDQGFVLAGRVLHKPSCGGWTHCGWECCGPCPTCHDQPGGAPIEQRFLLEPPPGVSKRQAGRMISRLMRLIEHNPAAGAVCRKVRAGQPQVN